MGIYAKIIGLSVVAVILALSVSFAPAAVYYVSSAGDDTSAGTAERPLRTFAKAMSVVGPGDEVKIYPGIYNERLIIDRSGTPTEPITVSPVSDRPVIDLNFLDQNGLDISADFIVVKGVEIREAKDPGASDGMCVEVAATSQHVVLDDLVVHDCQGHGIHIAGQYVVLQNSSMYLSNLSFEGTTQSWGWGSGIKVKVGGENVIIRNNRVFHNFGEGIASTRGRSITIENNTVYDNFAVNIYIDNTIGATVRNNFSYCTGDTRFDKDGQSARGIEIAEEFYDGWGSQGRDISIYNNIIYSCYFGITAWHGGVAGAAFRNLQIGNNTIWNIGRTGFSTDTLPTEGTNFFKNNLVQAANADVYSELTDGFEFATNHWASGEPFLENVKSSSDIYGGKPGFITTPAFSDPDTFRLSPNSPTKLANIGAFGDGFSPSIGAGTGSSRPSTPANFILIHEQRN